MLEIIAVILIALWLLGFVSAYTHGRIHSYSLGHSGCGDPGSCH